VADASGRQQVYQYDCAGRLAQALDGDGVEAAIRSNLQAGSGNNQTGDQKRSCLAAPAAS
jgi:hypothetical protein